MYDQDTNTYELEYDKPLVLLLGNIAREGILSLLQASDRQYKQKILKSKPENWQSIIDYFNNFDVRSVLVKLDKYAISAIASDQYKSFSEILFRKIAQTSNMVFVYEDLLAGKIEKGVWAKYYRQPNEEELSSVLNFLENLDLELIPYSRNAQITVLAESFLTDTEENLLFRLYVPTGRMWSSETDTLLKLFRDYLSSIGQLKVRLDQQQTDKGSIYEFHSDQPKDGNDLTKEFSEFTHFLDLCVNDQTVAESVLSAKNIDQKKIAGILSRYGKEARRLHVDIKQEREIKILNIKHRLESELIDNLPGNIDWNAIGLIVESTVPSPIGSNFALISPLSKYNSNLTINVNPQTIGTVHGIVAQEINGNQNLGTHGQELLELVQKYGEEKSVELTSAVYEIEDNTAPKASRLKANQKIKSFLYAVGRKSGDIAVGLLQSYIEKQIGL